jgi:hypothetical protein
MEETPTITILLHCLRSNLASCTHRGEIGLLVRVCMPRQSLVAYSLKLSTLHSPFQGLSRQWVAIKEEYNCRQYFRLLLGRHRGHVGPECAFPAYCAFVRNFQLFQRKPLHVHSCLEARGKRPAVQEPGSLYQ